MVTHSIEGQIFTTVYAHLSGINASSGQSVSKGQLVRWVVRVAQLDHIYT
jgi:hypothetical protein